MAVALSHAQLEPASDLRGRAAPRTVIVANRLPFTIEEAGTTTVLRPSAGGLATALASVHGSMSSLWLGWSGTSAGAAERDDSALLADARVVAIDLTRDEADGYYRRFANGVLWPALHGFPLPDPADRDAWPAYQAVNARFAQAVARQLEDGDQVWIHDYHLMLVPALLRRLAPRARIGFFLHTPFAPGSEALAHPHWGELLRGLAGADVVGVQTRHDAEALMRALAAAGAVSGHNGHARVGSRTVRVSAFPIGADIATFAALASSPAVREQRLRLRDGGGTLFVGVDRLDYTKGIPQRLRAFERLLESDRELARSARLVQVAVPSRDGASGYAELRDEVEGLVTRINDRFGRDRHRPVEYLHGTVDRARLAALYRAADVMLVTPLRDGMNLVAKEFVASRVDGDGVLVLGVGAGAAAELWPAVLVDPSDGVAMVAALRRAVAMADGERRARMARLRALVATNDVHRWNDTLLRALHVPRSRQSA